MTSSNSVFLVTELDFDQIKENLKNFFRSKDTFADYDFEGSGLSMFIDALAYNTHYMAWYQNMIANEQFLDTAQLRDSVVSHAKNLNYIPSSARGSVANVDVVVTPPDGNSITTLVLPKYTEFQSESIDGINYTFLTLESHSASKNLISNTFTFSSIQITEGENLSFEYTVNNNSILERFVLPNENIDTSTLSVEVQVSAEDSSSNTFVLHDDLTEIDGNTKIFFLEEANNRNFAIYFGDNYLGEGLANGNIVRVNFLVVNGANSNYANSFTNIEDIGGFSNVSVTTNSSAAGGGPRETLESVKFRAPIFYTSQNRAVTINDYSVLLLKDYPNIESVSVWSGEDNSPVVYGKLYISMKPVDNYVITDIEKSRIIEELIRTRNIVTVIPEIVDPDYLYLIVRSTINYDISRTTMSPQEIKSLVRQNIFDYANEELGKFENSFKYSRLQTVIDESDVSIENNNLNIILQKRFTPDLGETKNYEIEFNTELNRGGAFDKLYSYPPFTILDASGTSRTAYIEETPYSYTGIDSIDVINPGYDYETAPEVTITGDGVGAEAIAQIVNGRVVSIIVTNRGSDYTIANVELSGGNGREASASAVLTAKIGTVRTFYYKSNGEKIILNPNAGTIYYDTGKITLLNFAPIDIDSNQFYENGILTLNIKGNSQTIPPLRNRIVDIDPDDSLSVQITANPV